MQRLCSDLKAGALILAVAFTAGCGSNSSTTSATKATTAIATNTVTATASTATDTAQGTTATATDTTTAALSTATDTTPGTTATATDITTGTVATATATATASTATDTGTATSATTTDTGTATAATATNTATASATGTQTRCAEFVNLFVSQKAALACADQSDASMEATAACQRITSYTGCLTQFDAFLACARKQPITNWQCSGKNAKLTRTTCALEDASLSGCLSTTSTDGTVSCADLAKTDSDCNKCTAANCCAEAHAYYTNMEALALSACIFGNGTTEKGCRTSTGFDNTCIATCSAAHPAGVTDFGNAYYSSAGAGCLPTKCAGCH